LHTLREGHTDWIRKVSVNVKGTLFASSSKDETVIVWNIEKVKASTKDPAL
jgi:WD40 repeat protein